jgi:hypothetical protein
VQGARQDTLIIGDILGRTIAAYFLAILYLFDTEKNKISQFDDFNNYDHFNNNV